MSAPASGPVKQNFFPTLGSRHVSAEVKPKEETKPADQNVKACASQSFNKRTKDKSAAKLAGSTLSSELATPKPTRTFNLPSLNLPMLSKSASPAPDSNSPKVRRNGLPASPKSAFCASEEAPASAVVAPKKVDVSVGSRMEETLALKRGFKTPTIAVPTKPDLDPCDTPEPEVFIIDSYKIKQRATSPIAAGRTAPPISPVGQRLVDEDNSESSSQTGSSQFDNQKYKELFQRTFKVIIPE